MKSLSLSALITAQASSASGGTAVNGCKAITFLFPRATSGKLKGSSDGGSTYNDIEGTAFTGDGSIVPSITLLACRFDHVQATFAGTNPACVVIRDDVRFEPSDSLDRTKNITIADPVLGTA